MYIPNERRTKERIVGQKLKIFVSLAYAAIFLVFVGMGVLQSQASEPGRELLPVHSVIDENREQAAD
jgi:hypothetical protein